MSHVSTGAIYHLATHLAYNLDTMTSTSVDAINVTNKMQFKSFLMYIGIFLK